MVQVVIHYGRMKRGPKKQFEPNDALRAAMVVFRRHGYNGAGLTELLVAMQIGRKSMYDTFGTKRQLFLQAVALYARDELRDLNALLNAPGSPVENIAAALNGWQTVHGQPHSHGCGIGNSVADFACDDSEMATILRGYLQAFERAWATTLHRTKEAGELSPNAAPDDLAGLVLTAAQGTALLGRVGNGSALPASASRALLALIRSS